MINHVVVMKFKPGVTEDAIRDLEASLEQLPNKIMEIKMYEFGRDVLRSPRSYDFAVTALFANPAALDRYQNHPEHVPVAAKLRTMCESLVTVDFYGSDAGSTEAGSAAWERDPLEKLKL
jgi:hypothetical protein